MRCRRARRLVPDHVAGLLSARREEGVRRHLADCAACSDLADRERLVDDVLSGWSDLPLPEDGFHRLETRIAFLPPPAPPVRRGVLRSVVLPYAAGLATAAALLVLARAALPTAPAPDRPPPAEVSPVADLAPAPAPALMPGEQTLRFVDRRGGVVEVPWDEVTERWLRRALDRTQYDDLRRRMEAAPVDYEVR